MNAVRRIRGMEWLAELDEEQEADDDFYRPGRKGEPVGGRLYLVMSNRAALNEMLRLWAAYQANPERHLIYGFDRWRRLFQRLRDLRVWDVEDRFYETGLLDNWRFDIQNGRTEVQFEAELWFRRNPSARDRAGQEVSQAILDVGGQVRQIVVHEGIEYHGVLGSIPSTAVDLITAADPVRLVQLDEVMFFRPAGQSISVAPVDPPIPGDPNSPLAASAAQGPPRVGLLDGLPISNHAVLAGRLIVDDPQGWEQDYQAAERIHGTAMASLIVNGDLSTQNDPLPRPVYVRPVMKPDPLDFRTPRSESMPSDQLIVDLLHTAVRRIFEGDAGGPPVAPTVRVINLSIGDLTRPLDGPLSPFARMLDWLSWKYKVLFMVSAGNATEPISLGVQRTEVGALTPQDLALAVARSIHARAHLQRIISPSESINAITVGSLHDDDSGVGAAAPFIDPYPDPGYPSPINRIGLGFRRAVKPDLLFEGGIQLYRLSPTTNDGVLHIAKTLTRGPGQRVAAPGLGGDLRASRYTCGTSNATAIGTRSADQLLQMLGELNGDWSAEQSSLLTKVLLAHACNWTQAAEVFRNGLQMAGDYRDHIARYLGYGVVSLDRVLSCNPSRVTVIAAGDLADGDGHLYRLPLPPTLSGLVGIRKLILSLAWFTPINPLHRSYRRASLWIGSPESALLATRQEAQWQTVQRGTLQHEIFEGDSAVAFVDGSDVRIKVNCRADAGSLDGAVPYAIAATLEVADSLRVPVYQEVAERIGFRGEVRV